MEVDGHKLFNSQTLLMFQIKFWVTNHNNSENDILFHLVERDPSCRAHCKVPA